MIIVPNSLISYQGTAPLSPVTGQPWINSTNNIFYVWTSSSWQSLSFTLPDYVSPTYFSTASNIPNLTSSKIPTTSINYESDSYTLALSDAGKTIQMDKGTAQTITVPINASVSFSTGTRIDIIQTGAGTLSIFPSAGVTINSESGKLKIMDRYAGATLIKYDTDTWLLAGGLKL